MRERREVGERKKLLKSESCDEEKRNKVRKQKKQQQKKTKNLSAGTATRT